MCRKETEDKFGKAAQIPGSQLRELLYFCMQIVKKNTKLTCCCCRCSSSTVLTSLHMSPLDLPSLLPASNWLLRVLIPF